MSWIRGRWTAVSLLLTTPVTLVVLAICALAQVVTTTVTDTIYRADGTPAGGTVVVSWAAFTTSTGQALTAGSTSATIAANGVLTMALTPNAGATPLGTYYTVVYHLDDGSTNREYWVVPASSSSVKISSIRSSVLPTAVAMQTVSKSYVDTAIAAAVAGHPLEASNPYVLKAGDTMTGPLTLPGDPTASSQAATKNYVDASILAVAGGISQKVATLPSTTQTVTQPAGTQLEVNRLNGVEYASQYQDAHAGNGIANALASSDCTSGCNIHAEQNYLSAERYTPSLWNDGTHVEDERRGSRRDSFLNPDSALAAGIAAGQTINVTSTRDTVAYHQSTGAQAAYSIGLAIEHNGLSGGSNQFPEANGAPPYFKTTYSGLKIDGVYNTQGQHVLSPQTINCFGVGDCLIGAQFITASGGQRDSADEGAHPFDLQYHEDWRVFAGGCVTGCTTGSTAVTIASTAAAGTQGDGRFLMDTMPSKVITAGSITGPGASGWNMSAAFIGTSFPVSTFFALTTPIPSQADNVAPGTVTVAIATTGLPTGYASNTAAAPAQSGIACLADNRQAYNGVENFETANYTVIDGTHLQLTLNKAHYAGSTIAIGGLCGYGLEQKVDTVNGIRQVFPVIGSYSATGLYYVAHATTIVGVTGYTSAYANISSPIASATRSGNVVTLNLATRPGFDLNGLALTVAGIADSSYNGTFTVTSTGPSTLTYPQSGANSTSTGGTIALLTGSYALYPMAEVLSVFNPATRLVDGYMKLAPNNVNWAANDTVEQPHYHQEKIGADIQFVGQSMPRPMNEQVAGIWYDGNNGVGLDGWMIANTSPASNYYGSGGTHAPPTAAYVARGIWKMTMEAQAGEQSVFTIHCNSHTCGRWNSAYNLFELDSNAGADTMSFDPLSSSLFFTMRGSGYSITPQALNAGTINATTVNATNLNGAVSAASLPVFKASGATHAPGAVPDPGAAAGNTRFLREDGSWATPPAGGTTSSSSVAAVPSGATADYDFLQGSGSVLTDKSGNSNNGTLGTGTNAPSWTGNGLRFALPQYVSLPASLNATRTFYMAVYINPLPTAGSTFTTNTFPILLGNSAGGDGLNLLTFENANGTPWTFSPSIYSNNFMSTHTKHPMAGFHVLAYTLGTGSSDVDHIYIDGVEDNTYGAQGFSAGRQATGNFFLGWSASSNFATSGFNGSMYRALFYPGEHTADQVQATTGAILNDLRNRAAVPMTPAPATTGKPTLLAIGDSITYGQGLSAGQDWTAHMTLLNQPAYDVKNYGISGITLESILGSTPWRDAPKCLSSNGIPTVAVVFAGTNDIANNGVSAPDAVTTMIAELKTLKQAGCIVFAGTMISRNGVDSQKAQFDALLLNQAKLAGVDGIIDFAANPKVGANGAYANTTYFQADGIHPTAAGELELARAASNTLNRYFGYSLSSPHVIASSSYQMTNDDGAVTAAIPANAAWTLPDCVGPSGEAYRITNPQSTYSLTIQGQANQPINGLATPITVPPNSTVTLIDASNTKDVSGCHWVM